MPPGCSTRWWWPPCATLRRARPSSIYPNVRRCSRSRSDHLANVRIVSVSTLVVNVAHDVGASAIVKGLRAVSDFENELQMAQMNKQLSGVETLFIPTSSAHSFIASRLLREVARFGGDVTSFVPKVVAVRLQEKFADE